MTAARDVEIFIRAPERPASREEEECRTYGHTFDVVCTLGDDAPTQVICPRCGASWKVASDG